MGIGYVIGCLLSILLWKLDRQSLFEFINIKLKNKIKNIFVVQCIYLCAIIFIFIGLMYIKNNQLYNAITAFMIIDISNTERKNLKRTEKKYFYDTISTISRALICGFIMPLFYITILGNAAAIVFTIIYNLSFDEDYSIITPLFVLVTIIPSIIGEIFLYIVYIFRNRNLKINFKGDHINNLWKMPLLNVDILAAYIESVNFYYYYNGNNKHYMKSYGEYSNTIDNVNIKDYLSISYSICFIVFAVFILLAL